MGTLKQQIDHALLQRGVSAKQMLIELDIVEQTYYKALKRDSMKTEMQNKIFSYLNIERVLNQKVDDTLQKESRSIVSDGINMYEMFIRTIKEQAEEIALLKRELGKFDSTLFALSA